MRLRLRRRGGRLWYDKNWAAAPSLEAWLASGRLEQLRRLYPRHIGCLRTRIRSRVRESRPATRELIPSRLRCGVKLAALLPLPRALSPPRPCHSPRSLSAATLPSS
jgi:hypothetical protein